MPHGNDAAKSVRRDTVDVDTEGAVRAIAHRLTQYDAAVAAGDLAEARAHLANAAMVIRWIAYGVSIGAQREISAEAWQA